MEITQTAWIFPGQGSQFPGMGKEFYKKYSVAREIFDRADEALNFKISQLIFEGSSNDLMMTQNAQPAILIVSVAAAKVLESRGFMPSMVAGLSLGEYSALVVAGSLSLEDAVILTHNRGMYMQKACPPGKGKMAAIIGLANAEVEALCFASSKRGVVIAANYNCPGQVVISGETKAVEEACESVKRKGGKVFPLPVSAPFHCALMEPAALKLKKDLDSVQIHRPLIPIYSNVTAETLSTSEEIRQTLFRQVTFPVLWQVVVHNMIRDGASLFVEVGPGTVLSGFGKRIDRTVRFVPFANPQDLYKMFEFSEEAY